MRSIDPINSVDESGPFVGMLATEINDIDIFEHGIHRYIIETGTDPHTGQYFFYVKLPEMTSGVAAGTLMSPQVDTEKGGVYIHI